MSDQIRRLRSKLLGERFLPPEEPDEPIRTAPKGSYEEMREMQAAEGHDRRFDGRSGLYHVEERRAERVQPRHLLDWLRKNGHTYIDQDDEPL
jgi:hypothetical protein